MRRRVSRVACARQGQGSDRWSPSVNPSVEARIRGLLAEGLGILKIGRTLGVGTSVVQRVLIGVVAARSV